MSLSFTCITRDDLQRLTRLNVDSSPLQQLHRIAGRSEGEAALCLSRPPMLFSFNKYAGITTTHERV